MEAGDWIAAIIWGAVLLQEENRVDCETVARQDGLDNNQILIIGIEIQKWAE
jgi:hypothetical protein